MPGWMDRFANYVGLTAAPYVQRSAPYCTATISQCADPIHAAIVQDTDTEGGVCESLSAHWIIHHARGSSLWNWLCDGEGRVRMGPLWQVMNIQRVGVQAHNQNNATDQFLRQERIHRLPTMRASAGSGGALQGGHASAPVTGTTSFFSARALAEAIAADATTAGGRTGGQYKKIGVAGMGGAHAMAAWVAQDLVFYDPNFGEFWFATRPDFVRWFSGSFWTRSMYFAGLSGTFEVHSYGQAA